MTHKRDLRVGMWQAAGQAGDITANLAEIVRVAHGASGQIDLLIFPECFLTGYFTDASVAEIAASVTPACLDALSQIAATTGIALIVGSYEPVAGTIYNSALVFTPTEGHIGAYRKRMLFGAWETASFSPGRDTFTFEFNGTRIGVLICYDIEFPERARALGMLDVDLIAVPTALMAPFALVPEIIVPARAIENHCFVAYANRIGTDAANTYLGKSAIVDPTGQCLTSPDASERLIQATLDVSQRADVRAAYDYLADLRRDERAE